MNSSKEYSSNVKLRSGSSTAHNSQEEEEEEKRQKASKQIHCAPTCPYNFCPVWNSNTPMLSLAAGEYRVEGESSAALWKETAAMLLPMNQSKRKSHVSALQSDTHFQAFAPCKHATLPTIKKKKTWFHFFFFWTSDLFIYFWREWFSDFRPKYCTRQTKAHTHSGEVKSSPPLYLITCHCIIHPSPIPHHSRGPL